MAWASIAVPAWVRIWLRVKDTISCAMSVSRMRDSEADSITITGTTALADFTADITSLTAAGGSDAVQAQITAVSTQRAALGAIQNRFEHTLNNVNVAVENLSASESRIRDTDMAQEMVSFTRSQILSQAGTAMLAQANQSSQGVLQLLR